MSKARLRFVLLLAALAWPSCGDQSDEGAAIRTDHAAPSEDPSWADVAHEQIAEANKYGVPVAFENGLGMRFVLIPSGTFTMGSPPTEESRDEEETAHPVTLTRPYYLQTTEVTNGQYRRFRPDHDSYESDGHSLNGDDQPVVHISWVDAAAFAKWLTAKDSEREYRLPTEAEWERACRAGTSTPFWWGASISTDQANYDGNYVYGGGVEGVNRHVSLPVRSFPASPWGLYEVHGNVREWCADKYEDGDYPDGPRTDPVGRKGDSRIERGGAYSDGVFLLRAACRTWVQDGEARSYIGFRLAASLPAK